MSLPLLLITGMLVLRQNYAPYLGAMNPSIAMAPAVEAVPKNQELHMKMKIPLLCFKLPLELLKNSMFFPSELHTQIVAVSFAVLSDLFFQFHQLLTHLSHFPCVLSPVLSFFSIGTRKWPCGVCQRSLFAMALKRWAVRQISGLLSDYLEGITEQNLQAGNGDGRMVRWLWDIGKGEEMVAS